MDSAALPLLERIAAALERLSPPAPSLAGLEQADAFIWHPGLGRLTAVSHVAHVDMDLLQGINLQRKMLLDNTLHFARGLPANNAMLWGARGMGKSSLVKAAHAQANLVDGKPAPGQGTAGAG